MSVFGPSIKHTVELSGKTDDNEMILQGRMLSLTPPLGYPLQEVPNQILRVRFKRVDELP